MISIWHMCWIFRRSMLASITATVFSAEAASALIAAPVEAASAFSFATDAQLIGCVGRALNPTNALIVVTTGGV